MNKLGKKEEDCHDNIFPEIHFKDCFATKKTYLNEFYQNICETRQLEVKSQWIIVWLYVISLFLRLPFDRARKITPMVQI
jgi:hypothetical protein